MSIPPRPLPRIYIVRHGETAWSLSGRHTGQTDIPLTTRGEHDARGLATTLKCVRFNHVMTSPLQRASATCALAQFGDIATTNKDLGEWDYGDYEGLTPVEIASINPGWNVFDDGCPGGETPADVERRVDALIADVRGLEGTVGLFTHGHVGRAIAARWIGLGCGQGKHFLLDTASYGILSFAHRRPDEPVIQCWNIGQTALPERAADDRDRSHGLDQLPDLARRKTRSS